jgi:predicted PurR-regulated permease PerM
VLLILAVGALGYGAERLREPAIEWLASAPSTLEGLERTVRNLREPVERMSRAAARVEQMADVEGEENRRRGVQQVEVKERSRLEGVIEALPGVAVSTVLTLVLLYLLLVFDEDLLRNLVRAVPSMEEKRRVVEIARRVQSTISRYLSTITVINAGLGLTVGLALSWIGVPNPWLWGTMAGLLNYVPYLGGLVGVAIVAIVALSSLDEPLRALTAPLAYAAINSLEGLVLTPIVLGNRFSLNPVIIFVWLLLWGWLWGIGGALLAVPLLTVFKILCDATPSLNAWGRLLGRGA